MNYIEIPELEDNFSLIKQIEITEQTAQGIIFNTTAMYISEESNMLICLDKYSYTNKSGAVANIMKYLAKDILYEIANMQEQYNQITIYFYQYEGYQTACIILADELIFDYYRLRSMVGDYLGQYKYLLIEDGEIIDQR